MTLHDPVASPVRTPGLGSRPPPLENGDRLARCEFERRYAARPDVKKAELIEGVVHMASPVRAIGHARPTGAVVTWLGTYSAFTPRVSMLDNATVRLDLDNEPQPDALLRIDAEVGGRSYLSVDDYVEGPPELIVEVAASSAAYDLHDKLNAYRRNGVREYIVWRTFDGAIDWFVLADGEYRCRIPNVEGPNMEGPNMEGVVESRAFPGLRLAVAAMLADDLAAVLAELRRGIESPAHADFVAGLEADAKA